METSRSLLAFPVTLVEAPVAEPGRRLAEHRSACPTAGGTVLNVTHHTTYRYACPVRFGEHRMLLRPRDSHDLRLLEASLRIRPAAEVRWSQDPFGNLVAVARFDEPADELVVESSFRVRHRPLRPEEIELEPRARHLPFRYDAEEKPDLARCMRRHAPDPDRVLTRWARGFLRRGGRTDTLELLTAMTRHIREAFTYIHRSERGTQPALVTLHKRSGTCRDFALLMMEAVRTLGLAARFVSGYLYDESLVGEGQEAMVGGGETHAWVQVYLPGAGWVEFDPTNALVGGRNLIRIAVAREPVQALPLHGTYFGGANASLGMHVDVEVTAAPPDPQMMH